jgi:hypothetical protein
MFIYDLSNFSFNLEIKKWTEKRYRNSPAGRSDHMGCRDAKGNKLYIFGGTDGAVNSLNDLYEFDIISEQWKQIDQNGNIPEGRAGGTLHYFNNYLILCGGGVWIKNSHWSERFNDIRFFDIKKSTWLDYKINTPFNIGPYISTILIDHFLFFIGVSNTKMEKTVSVIDILTSKSFKIGEMNTITSASIVFDEETRKIYVIGGIINTDKKGRNILEISFVSYF